MKNRLFTLICLMTFTVFSFAQEWKTYPYHEEGTLINFPDDEGWHEGESIEWWYTTAHLVGETTGNEYTVMLTYFYYDTLVFDGFRLLNIANETTGEFDSEMQVCTYPNLATSHLDIKASLFPSGSTETWVTATDDSGNLKPFEYEISAASGAGAIELYYNTVKRPLILGDIGFFNQGIESYTYYYSLTGIEASGTLTFGDITENVSGTAWIDRQYGNFNPLTGENYEWFSLQLSNGMDINLWNIFTYENQIPEAPEYRLLSAYVDEDSSFTISDFELTRLDFFETPDLERHYAKRWRLVAESEGIDLIISSVNTDSELELPFHFFEGSTIIEGSVNDVPVTGYGFAELLHQYEHPQLSITQPVVGWTLDQPISWELMNPDEGSPMYYDIDVSFDNQVTFTSIAKNLTETSFYWDPEGFPLQELYWFRITAHSIDSTLIGIVQTPMAYPISTSINDQEYIGGINIYPNPTTEFILLDLKNLGPDELEVRIVNYMGQTVLSQKLNNSVWPHEISLVNLHPGDYFIKILSNEIRLVRPLFKI
jgi:predicted secreted hydrolase